jgi:hypothetical protein
VRQISADSPPGAFALAASVAGGKTTWFTASASTLFASEDGGHRFAAVPLPPEGRILRLFGSPLPSPIVVTDRGVYAIRAGLDFERLETITGGVLDAELVTDGAGRPELEVRTSTGIFRGVTLFEKSRIPLLSGGMYRTADPSAARNPFLRFDVHESNLTIRRGTETASLVLPRTELQVSDAILAGDGSLYLATMGDGLFHYAPEAPAAASGSR